MVYTAYLSIKTDKTVSKSWPQIHQIRLYPVPQVQVSVLKEFYRCLHSRVIDRVPKQWLNISKYKDVKSGQYVYYTVILYLSKYLVLYLLRVINYIRHLNCLDSYIWNQDLCSWIPFWNQSTTLNRNHTMPEYLYSLCLIN